MAAINDRFIEARESTGMRPAEWARAIGVSKANVTRMETVAKSASPDTLTAIEEVSGYRGAYILHGVLPKKVGGDNLQSIGMEEIRSLPHFRATPNRGKFPIPLQERPAGGPARVLSIQTVEGDGMQFITGRDRPPGTVVQVATAQARGGDAYAVRITGDAFDPRYRHGDIIICEPDFDPPPGADALVVMADGRRLLKRVKWRQAGAVVLEPVNRAGVDITLPLDQIDALHGIVDIIPAAVAELPTERR